MGKAILNSTLEVMWPIPPNRNLIAAIKKVSDLMRKQYPGSLVWIHSIHVGNKMYVGKDYVDGNHRVPIKACLNTVRLRHDHFEILFLLKRP